MLTSPCKNCGRVMDMSCRVWIGRQGFYCTQECIREAEGLADPE